MNEKIRKALEDLHVFNHDLGFCKGHTMTEEDIIRLQTRLENALFEIKNAIGLED